MAVYTASVTVLTLAVIVHVGVLINEHAGGYWWLYGSSMGSQQLWLWHHLFAAGVAAGGSVAVRGIRAAAARLRPAMGMGLLPCAPPPGISVAPH